VPRISNDEPYSYCDIAGDLTDNPNANVWDDLTVCDPARRDNNNGDVLMPSGDTLNVYDKKIRAFPVYQRPTPDLTLPQGYQTCYDVVDLHILGGNNTLPFADSVANRGEVYFVLQGQCTDYSECL
jgi:hypothetical protein